MIQNQKYSSSYFAIIICTSLIFTLGLLMVFNASSADALELNQVHRTHQALFRQIYSFLVSLVICSAFYFIGYKELVKLSPLLFTLLILSLLLVFIPKIGRTVNGARRWIVIGSFVTQPSEFVKVIMPLFFVQSVLGRNQSFKSLTKIFSIICIPIFLVMIQPSNGVTATLSATFIVLLFLSRISYKWWLTPILVFGLMGGFAALKVPYVQARIRSYMHPEEDLLGKGHQPFQAKIAAGSGGLIGKGFGKSMQKHQYLPEAQNDYIAAIYAEEMGFLGILLLIILYMLIGYFGFHIALKSPSKEGGIIAATLTFAICLQAFLNLAVVSGLMPSTGLNLPFFSQGGSSLLANMLCMTLLLNIASKQHVTQGLQCLKKLS